MSASPNKPKHKSPNTIPTACLQTRLSINNTNSPPPLCQVLLRSSQIYNLQLLWVNFETTVADVYTPCPSNQLKLSGSTNVNINALYVRMYVFMLFAVAKFYFKNCAQGTQKTKNAMELRQSWTLCIDIVAVVVISR